MSGYVGSDLDARHEQKRRRLNCHTLPEDRRRSTCVQTNGISASVLASGVFRGATLLIEKRSLCRQIRSGRVCKIRAVVLTCDVGPNITGTWWARGPEKGVSEASGAFVLTEPSNYGRGHDSGGATAGIDFSADRATGIYGGSSTVQPASIHALACIKV